MKEALLRDLEENSEKETKTASGFLKPSSKPDKNVIRKSDETPSYTGGVSKEARNRMESRQIRDKERKTHASSKVDSQNFIIFTHILLMLNIFGF